MTVYAYCRVSTDEQGVSGISLIHQETVCLKSGNATGEKWGNDRFPETCSRPGFFVDVVSSYRTPFDKRPAGKALLDALDPGDVIVISRVDRAFRSTLDFCRFLKLALENDWNLVCDSQSIDLRTPFGRMMAKLYVVMAEMESDLKGVRIKEALAVKKKKPSTARSFEQFIQEETDYRSLVKKLKEPPQASKPGRLFVYLRCSHRSSAESGLGLRAQLNASCAYVEQMVADNPNLTWSESVFTDAAVSARDVPLFMRPQGKLLNSELREGDVVVCLRPDRVFGSIHDMSRVLIDWKNRGIGLRFAEFGFDLNSPGGDMFLSTMVAFAQFEREMCSVRAKETRAVLEGKGKFTGGRNGHFPMFYREVSDPERKRRRLVLDAKQLSSFRLLDFLAKKIGINKALERVEYLISLREGRKPLPQCGAVKARSVWKNTDIPPNNKGEIFPMWTRLRYHKGRSQYAAAKAAWDARVREEKKLLREISEQQGFHQRRSLKRKVGSRWWVNRPPTRVVECFGVG